MGFLCRDVRDRPGFWQAVLHCGCILISITCFILYEIYATLLHSPYPNETDSIEVSLDHWADHMHILLSFWSCLWLIYALTTVFQRNVFGPVCCNPEVHPPSFYLTGALIYSVKSVWLMLWHNGWMSDNISELFFFWILPPTLSFWMLFLSYRNLQKNHAWLSINSPRQIWFIRYLTQNGLALFSWWSTLLALVNLGVLMKSAGLKDSVASALVLTILLLAILLWFAFETFVFKKYICYTFTVYPAMIFGLGAMFTRSYRIYDFSPNTIYCGFMMLLVTVLCTVQLVGLCCDIRPLTSIGRENAALRPEPCQSVCHEVIKKGMPMPPPAYSLTTKALP